VGGKKEGTQNLFSRPPIAYEERGQPIKKRNRSAGTHKTQKSILAVGKKENSPDRNSTSLAAASRAGGIGTTSRKKRRGELFEELDRQLRQLTRKDNDKGRNPAAKRTKEKEVGRMKTGPVILMS